MPLSGIFGEQMLEMGNQAARMAKKKDGRTNPNAQAGKKGKNAKSNLAAIRQAELAMQQQQNNQDFLTKNVFDPTGSKQKNRAARVEGMDFFDKTGPDRQSVKDRQARVDGQGLNAPGVWEQGQQAVLDAKKAQGWLTPNTPPSASPGPSMDQILRQNTPTMDVFNNPSNDVTNPRTGLVTNDGPFVRSRPNPYGSARAEFTPKQPAGEVTVGPVQELFGPPQVMNRMDPPDAVFSPPMQPPQPQPSEEQWMQQNPNAGDPLEWLKSLFLPDPAKFQQLPPPGKPAFQFAPLL